MNLLRMVRAQVERPGFQLFLGVVLVGTGLWDSIEALEADFEVGSHHGVLVLGLVYVLKSLPDFVEGLSRLSDVAGRDGQG